MMAARFEVGAQLAVIVNLAVENDGDLIVLARRGLLARLQVNDGEASHPERHARCDHRAFRIRPAMRHALAHRVQ